MESNSARHTSLSELLRNKRQIESDAQLLSNRIKLLQLEEQRTLKKIKSTRKQAHTVLATRRRDEARQHFFDQLRLEEERQISMKKEQNLRMRESMKTEHQQSMETLRELKRKKVLAVKKMLVTEREKRNSAMGRLREENYLRAKQIQTGRKEALIRVHSQRSQKHAFVRESHYQRLTEEDRAIRTREQEVMNMELLEMELIEKLKTTQIMQQQANDVLETALSFGTKNQDRTNSLGNSR